MYKHLVRRTVGQQNAGLSCAVVLSVTLHAYLMLQIIRACIFSCHIALPHCDLYLLSNCCLFTGSMPEGSSQQQYVREDSVSLSDSAKEPSNDSEYMQPRHLSLDDDYSDDTTSARGRCTHKQSHASMLHGIPLCS